MMYIVKYIKFVVLLLFFTLKYSNVYAFDFDIEVGLEKNKQDVFYNEKKDCDDYNFCKKEKNYAKIGYENYSQKDIFRKFYIGFDINWYLKRFDAVGTLLMARGDNYEKNPTLYSTQLFDRLKNFNIYLGFRMFKYFGFDVGYSHFGNIYSRYVSSEYYISNSKNFTNHGIFADIFVYTPPLFLFQKISIEGYASAGGVVYFTRLNNNRGIGGAKFGAGLLIHIIGAFAINVGTDYYYPLMDMSGEGIHFSKKGLISIKTGFNFYLNI